MTEITRTGTEETARSVQPSPLPRPSAIVTGTCTAPAAVAVCGALFVTLPAFILIAVAASLGFGLWLTALNVKYRDFRHVIPFIVTFGLYVSPVGFSSDVIPERWRLLYSMNPMVGVIDGFRWALLGERISLYWPGFLLSLVVVVAMLYTGIRYFRATEKSFADII